MLDLLERCADLPRASFAPGELLVEDGVQHSRIYVLIDGELEIRKGGVKISTIAQPGACIGEVGLLLGTPATATVVAASPVTVHVAEDGAALLRTDPEFTFIVARMLAQRLDLVTSFLADLRQQYGGESGSLAVVDTVLASLAQRPGATAAPGSRRDPEPLY